MAKYLLVVISLVLLSACAGGSTSAPMQGELKILDHSLSTHEFTGGTPQSTATVKGRAQNVGESPINYAQIAVDFYTKDGSSVGMASAVTQNLKPGEIWYFSVQLASADAWKSVKYKIVASTK